MTTRLRFPGLFAAAIGVGLATVLPGCASGGKGGDAQVYTSFQSAEAGLAALVGEWTVFELQERPITELLHDSAAKRPMLSIKADGTAGGFSGVNQFGSELRTGQLTKGRFELGPIAMTRMAGPPEMMSIEAKVTLALSEARRFSLKDDVLSLMPAEGRADPVVRFRREVGGATGAAGAR
jgi:heat shock protein HslJ